MRLASALPAIVLAALLAAPTAHGLTLLNRDPGSPERFRVHVDEPPLRGEADANVSLAETEIGAELEPLDVETGPWRGYANVTSLNATGTGWLVLADGASGLAVHLDEQPSSEEANASAEREPEPADEPRSADEGREEPSSEPAGEPSSSSERTEASSRDAAEEAPTSEAEGPPSPAVLVLTALAVGAFLVDRLLARGEEA